MSTAKPMPSYIGITGFNDVSDTVAATVSIPDGNSRHLMVGILASHTSLQNRPTKWPFRYPRPREIATLFPDYKNKVLNLIHLRVPESAGLLHCLCEAEHYGERDLHGFQLNMPWPDIDPIKRWLASRQERREEAKKPGRWQWMPPHDYIVLGCGNLALEKAGRNPSEIARHVEHYKGIVDYALIDTSGGMGEPMDPQFAINCLTELHSMDLGGMKFAVAGGLSAETLPNLVGPILEKFPDTSFDAEGRLRDGQDVLERSSVESYLRVAYEMTANKKK